VKTRMRGKTLRHCSRSMLSSPWRAMAQVPRATASWANMRRLVSKSLARHAASNALSQVSAPRSAVGMGRIVRYPAPMEKLPWKS
jgi:hypothetical protein